MAIAMFVSYSGDMDTTNTAPALPCIACGEAHTAPVCDMWPRCNCDAVQTCRGCDLEFCDAHLSDVDAGDVDDGFCTRCLDRLEAELVALAHEAEVLAWHLANDLPY